MARAKRNRKSVSVTPKRKADGRKLIPLKGVKTITKNRKIDKSQKNAQMVTKKQWQQGKTTTPVTPRTSRRLANQKQNSNGSFSSTGIMYAKAANTTDTILIEDTDEEIEANMSNMQLDPTKLFYEDRNPGLRDLDVPLYETERKIDKPGDATCELSVIELDNTMDNTQENLPAKLNDAQPQSSSMDHLGTAGNRLPITNPAMKPPGNQLQVIDLSDDSDDASSTPSYVPVQSIPLGYSIAKPKPNNKIAHKKQQPNRSNKTDLNPSFAPPRPTPSLSQPTGNNNATETRTKRMIVIDGNNVAFGHLNGKMFSVKGLHLCIQYFKNLGHEVVAVVPQYKLKRNQSTDQELLQQLSREGDVILAPSKNIPGQFTSPYDDRLLFAVAEKFDGVIVSNDNFRDLHESTPAWRKIIETRVVGYTWVKDFFFVPDDPYGRHGPSLQEILHR